MNMERKDTAIERHKPQVFLNSISFNDGTKISLKPNSIVVFTGANNCGKSQVLKDIELWLNGENQSPTVVIKDLDVDFIGSIDEETFLHEHFFLNSQGYYQILETRNAFSAIDLQHWWNQRQLANGLYTLFIKRLTTELRLTASNALDRSSRPERNAIYKLFYNESLEQEISDYFYQAFKSDLIVNRREMQTVPLHIGQAPDKTSFTVAQEDDYYDKISRLPKLQDQGDGMRSFASILLDTFTSQQTITLIDEPEAFLHPPQARILGKMLAKNNSSERQLLISTHSEDFLQGLFDADSENVLVIRINRMDNINQMSVLNNNQIKELWKSPILRYSNILTGLFHEKVVVCESDYDCLFYQAIMNSMYEYQSEFSDDILFTHCGGKARIKDIVKALKAINVPVVAICDFDILNNSGVFRPLIEAFGLRWSEIMSAGMQSLYNEINAQNSSGSDYWALIKKTGKAGLLGTSPAEYEKVEKLCQSIGLFVVPVGEIECFDKTVNKEKKDWVYCVLEKYNLATEPKLDEARKFMQKVVSF